MGVKVGGWAGAEWQNVCQIDQTWGSSQNSGKAWNRLGLCFSKLVYRRNNIVSIQKFDFIANYSRDLDLCVNQKQFGRASKSRPCLRHGVKLKTIRALRKALQLATLFYRPFLHFLKIAVHLTF